MRRDGAWETFVLALPGARLRSVHAPAADPPERDIHVSVSSPEQRGSGSAVRAARHDERSGFGLLPYISVVCATALLCIAFAYTLARQHQGGATALYWAGMLLLVLPPACQLVRGAPSRRERIGLLLLVGLGLYLVKVFHDPLGFTQHDEFLHWHTTDEILRTGHLFGPNSLLPVSPLYPGLENVTSALASISGLSIFLSGLLVVGVARAVLLLSLFLFLENVSHSSRIAALGAFFYCLNFSFLFFDAQFSYESLALPLTALVLYMVARSRREPRSWRSYALIALLLFAVVLTHHLTSYALGLFLALWWFVAWCRSGLRRRPGSALIGWAALATLTLALIWLLTVANITIGYLAPTLHSAVTEVLKIATRQTTGRAPFQSYAGETFAPWERALSLAAVALIVLSILAGVLLLWQRRRKTAGAITLALTALAFPASQLLRLTRSGSEFASRAPEFFFVGIAFLEAVVYFDPRWPRLLRRGAGPLFAAAVAVLLMGSIFTGTGPTSRLLPGTYRVAADSESIEPEGIGVANWARTHLGPGNHIATDRVDNLLLGSYGEQYPVTNLADHVNIAPVFFSTELTPYALSLLKAGHIRYLVVDKRLSEGLPLFGVYFEDGEQDSYHHLKPIDLFSLTKFDYIPGVSKIFDGGDIAVYDVGALSGAH